MRAWVYDPHSGGKKIEKAVQERARRTEVLSEHLTDLTKRIVADVLDADLSEPKERPGNEARLLGSLGSGTVPGR